MGLGMNIALRRPMSREDFFDWDGHLEGRYEFDGVRPVAITGGNVWDSVIISTILLKLGIRLAGSAWFASGPETGIATVGSRVRYPDVVVSRSRFGPDDKLLASPVVVFEVASLGSRRTDKVVKPVEYAGVASILRNVIVESSSVAAIVRWRERGDEVFQVREQDRADVAALPELRVEVPLLDLYERVMT